MGDLNLIEDEVYNDLLARGKEKGQMSIDEIYALFDGFDGDIVDKLVEESITNGVKIVDTGTVVQRQVGEAEEIGEGGISALLRDLRRYPTLSTEENIELAKRVEQGDEDAKEYMVNCNMWLVISMAHKYLGKGVLLEDLVSAGSMGLIVACQKYDYRRDIKFSTYAFWWIRQYLRFAMAECGQVARLPMYVYNKLCQYKKAIYELTQQHNKLPTDEEVATYMGEDIETIKTLYTYNQMAIELDAPAVIDEDKKDGKSEPIDLADMIVDTRYNKDALSRQRAYNNIIDTFDILTPREKAVIEQRYGIGSNAQTLDTIGKDFKLTKERIRQIENDAMRKLRHPLNLKRIYGIK